MESDAWVRMLGSLANQTRAGYVQWNRTDSRRVWTATLADGSFVRVEGLSVGKLGVVIEALGDRRVRWTSKGDSAELVVPGVGITDMPRVLHDGRDPGIATGRILREVESVFREVRRRVRLETAVAGGSVRTIGKSGP